MGLNRFHSHTFLGRVNLYAFLLLNWPLSLQSQPATEYTVYSQRGILHVPALWRRGRLLLLELSSTSTMVGAGLSDASVLCVVIVVGVVLVVVVVLAVVVVEVVGTIVVAMGSATVASMVSRTISAPPSSDWFSVT